VQPHNRSDAQAAGRVFDSLSLFTFFWAVGVLTHQGYHGRFGTAWHDAILIVAAFAALLRPSSVARLAFLAAAALTAVFVEMPDVYNHWLLVGLASGMVLLVLAVAPWRRETDVTARRAVLYHSLAPPLRLMLLGTYAFAFLAKLNPHFLSDRVSCAAITYPRLAGRLTVLPVGDWTRTAAIWFTLLMEAVVPLTLAIRSTRTASVFVALAFHATMGLAAFYDFSAAAAGFLVLFLPDDTPARLSALAHRHPRIGRIGAAVAATARSPWSLPVLLTTAYVVFGQVRRIETPFLFTMRLWIVFTLAASAVLVLSLVDPARPASRPGRLTLFGRMGMFGAILIALDAASSPLPFSLMAAALLTALVPADAPQELARTISGSPLLSRAADRMRLLARHPAAIPVGLLLAYLVMSRARHWDSPLYFVLAGLGAWWGGRLLVALLSAARDAPVRSHLRVRPAFAIGPILVLLNGLSPYVGLKTEHSFTMFSNLMTEGDRWNHYLLPPSMKLFPLQDDLVTVVRSSDQRFRQFAERRTQLVWVHFRSLVSRYPHIRITYERAGQTYEVARVGDDPVLSRPPARAIDKLMDFRTVPRRNVCRH
jgi:hypothetical protein